ncbi:MAG: transglycosylase domain-containing protein [Bacteroidota bacterium]
MKGLPYRIIKRISIGITVLFLLLILSIPIYIYSIRVNAGGLFGEMPNLEELENPKSQLASVIHFADGPEMGKYFRENRNRVTFDQLSPALVNALLSTEDHRFYEHSGIDFIAVVRAIRGVLTLDYAGGGSTLSQQLAKNLFKIRRGEYDGFIAKQNDKLKIIIEKTKEWILASILEQSYSKKEILAMYLNTVDFGSNSFGIKTAAQTFFKQTTDSLSVTQSAMLVGLVQRPSWLSPVRHPERALERRNVVMSQMLKHDHLSKEEFDSLKNIPLELDYSVESHNTGSATYFRSVARNFLISWAKENDYDLFASGLRVYTTIDSRLQTYAEEALKEHMKSLQEIFNNHLEGRLPWINDRGQVIPGFLDRVAKRTPYYRQLVRKYGTKSDSVEILMNKPREMTVFSWDGDIDTVLSPIDSIKYYKHFLHAGFMAMNPHNGHIKAWVGGINHEYFQFDHVKQGIRQPGSTFKPILYAAAIENGYSPCYTVTDAPITFEVYGDPPTWTPANSDDDYEGEIMTIRQAMGRSMNRIAAYMIDKIGPQAVADLGKKLGIESPLAAVPSLCLGTSDLSLYELIGAYGTFVNEGVYTEPIFISKIEDKNGNLIQSFVPKTREVLNDEVAYLMLHMLRGATEEEGGTARGLGYEILENNEVGGKTGTTQNASDGWFMGVTKDLVAGTWVGGDDKPIHFRSWVLGQGARTAMPIYRNFIKKVYKDSTLNITKGKFKKPKSISVELDCNKYGELYQTATDTLGVYDSLNLTVPSIDDIE